MSQANVDYVLTHNPEIPVERMNICPNSIEIQDMRLTVHERENIRDRYDIPQDKKVFVYGGNLGKPQGIPFVIQCLSSQAENKDVYFIIVGDGTEYGKLETYFRETHPKNMRLMKRLPKNDFDRIIAACDVGMIFWITSLLYQIFHPDYLHICRQDYLYLLVLIQIQILVK